MSYAIGKFKEVFLILGLILFVLGVNHALITWNMMYIEQPIIYKANASIHTWKDLLDVYLHPKLLNSAIPFFRPSGHFLMYQLITPFLGWYNTKALMVINLIFLALTGYFMIKLYEILFPRYKMGGYVAFALYLMQPALIISRITILHFEFSYVFFVTLSSYYFARFCQKNIIAAQKQYTVATIKNIKFDYSFLFFWSVLFYIIGITFKEPAVMLAPVLASYLLIMLYNNEPFTQYISGFIRHKDARKIIFILALTSIAMVAYLTIPMTGTLLHEAHKVETPRTILAGICKFLLVLISAHNNFKIHDLYGAGRLFDNTIVTAEARYIVWSVLALTLWSVWQVIKDKTATQYKKSLLFLLLACLAFLVLPVLWVMGFPWHASLSLLFFSFILGFGTEYFCRAVFKNNRLAFMLGFSLAFLIGLNTIVVNNANIKFLSEVKEYRCSLLNRNAILNPPKIRDKLNVDSVVVVADSANVGSYNLGNSRYPFFILYNKELDFNNFLKTQKMVYVQDQPVYSGILFTWAYLLPNLKEEVYPFQVENMQEVPDPTIYDWLQHFDNIFCLGYDANLNWHDLTAIFKKNLLAEKNRRHLIVNHYEFLPGTALSGKYANTYQLLYPNPQYCQVICDKITACKGFTYVAVKAQGWVYSKCHFYPASAMQDRKPCPVCTGFIKA